MDNMPIVCLHIINFIRTSWWFLVIVATNKHNSNKIKSYVQLST